MRSYIQTISKSDSAVSVLAEKLIIQETLYTRWPFTCRHRRPRTHHFLPPRIYHLSLALPQPLLVLLISSRRPQRCPAFWPSRLRQNHARKSPRQGVWCDLHQHRRVRADEQVVWRVEQARRGVVQPGAEDPAEYHFHRRDRFVFKGKDKGGS